MAIRYVIKNKRGNYFSGKGKTGFTKDIEKADIYWKEDALRHCFRPDEIVQKVDIQITELQ